MASRLSKNIYRTCISMSMELKGKLESLMKAGGYTSKSKYVEDLLDDICIKHGFKTEIFLSNGGNEHRKTRERKMKK